MMERLSVTAARIIEQRSHVVSGALKVTEHFFEVPRNWRAPSAGTLRIFARSAQKHEVPVTPLAPPKNEEAQYLCYFQGGPGCECSPPQYNPWARFFIDKGYHVVCLDQRGTGLSSPVSSTTLAAVGDEAEQASYLKCFRADSIACDAEAIRMALTTPEEATQGDDGQGSQQQPGTASAEQSSEAEAAEGLGLRGRPWSVIGQSFGGFCIATYLSMFPRSLTECFTFGGTPPVNLNGPDEVYRRLAQRVLRQNESYYAKYPEDIARVKRIVRALSGNEGPRIGALPDGGSLSARRFLAMGIKLGFHTGIDAMHDVVLRLNSELETTGQFGWGTLQLAASQSDYDTRPLYAILHEPIYCQGEAASWSAQRALQELPEFDLARTLEDEKEPVRFYGEMVLPFMFKDYAHLRQMAGVAQQLAADKEWPRLYDVDVLKSSKVPWYAAVYMHDMYVDFGLAQDTLATIGSTQPLITNLVYHDGLRSRAQEVLGGLWKLRTDVID